MNSPASGALLHNITQFDLEIIFLARRIYRTKRAGREFKLGLGSAWVVCICALVLVYVCVGVFARERGSEDGRYMI